MIMIGDVPLKVIILSFCSIYNMLVMWNYIKRFSSNNPWTNISHLKIIYQDNKQVAREATEVIYIRMNNPALRHNTGKMYIP